MVTGVQTCALPISLTYLDFDFTPIVKTALDKIVVKSKSRYVNASLIAYMLILFLATAYLVNETYNPFLYFRF